MGGLRVIAWGKDEVAQLTSLWNEGLTCSQIARVMGHGVTRNAVIGKLHRLKLSKHKAAGAPQFRASSWERKRMLPESLPGDMTRLRGAAWDALPGTTPVALLDLEPGMCRWPIGEGSPFRFCAAPSGEGSYCVTHTRASAGAGSSMERAAIKFAVDANKAEWKQGMRAQERKWESA